MRAENQQFSSDLSSVRTSVQFGPPRLLLELVSDSNCLEDRGRILVILPFINLAARTVTTELTPSYQPQKGQATAGKTWVK